MDQALLNVMGDMDKRDAAFKSGPRPAPTDRVIPNRTPEMIREAEQSHLRGDARMAAAAEQRSPLSVAIDDETLKILAKARGWSFQDPNESHGGVVAEHEATIATLKETNAKLVERVNRAEKEARDAQKEAGDAVAELKKYQEAPAQPPSPAPAA